MSDLTSAQIRGARGMLNWSMMDLAKAARVSISTIKRMEDKGAAVVSAGTVGLLRVALEAQGVEFLADEGGGPGMRLRACQASPVARFF